MSGRINKSEAFDLLLKICPDAHEAWQEHQLEWQDEEAPYLGMAVFARHIIDLWVRYETESFPEVFSVIERLIVEGDDEVRDLAIVGFLEGLQNNAPYGAFRPWLKPTSWAAWQELEELWAGEDSLMGVIRKIRRQS